MERTQMTVATRVDLDSLCSPGFCLALALLLINDFVLKQSVPGPVTGKLSDFAGLFAIAFFATALASRYRLAIHLATAVLFVIWKLPIASPVIRAWNDVAPFAVDRVVDLSDLWALTILPASYWYSARRSGAGSSGRLWRWPLATVAVFAFAATSYSTHEPMTGVWTYSGSREQLSERLTASGVKVFDDAYSTTVPRNGWALLIPSDVCGDFVEASVAVQEVGRETEIRLVWMKHRCPRGKDDAAKLRNAFLRNVVKPLALRPAGGNAATVPYPRPPAGRRVLSRRDASAPSVARRAQRETRRACHVARADVQVLLCG